MYEQKISAPTPYFIILKVTLLHVGITYTVLLLANLHTIKVLSLLMKGVDAVSAVANFIQCYNYLGQCVIIYYLVVSGDGTGAHLPCIKSDD